jgi:hypothetical protein
MAKKLKFHCTKFRTGDSVNLARLGFARELPSKRFKNALVRFRCLPQRATSFVVLRKATRHSFYFTVTVTGIDCADNPVGVAVTVSVVVPR